MGHRHSRAEIVQAAVAVAQADGLAGLTFGRVAQRIGTSDRMVVYYLPTKDEMVGAVLGELGGQLQSVLAGAFTAAADDHLDLARTAWPVLATAEADAVFALYFEALGLAASGREPYRSVVPAIVEAWVEWTAGLLSGSAARRRGEAHAALALLDGLLLLRNVAGADAAAGAARRMGVTGRDRPR